MWNIVLVVKCLFFALLLWLSAAIQLSNSAVRKKRRNAYKWNMTNLFIRNSKNTSFYHACMIRDKLNFFSLSGMNEAKRESRRLSSRGRRKLKQSIRNAIKDNEIPKALNLVGHLVSIVERSNKQNYWVCKHLGFPNSVEWATRR